MGGRPRTRKTNHPYWPGKGGIIGAVDVGSTKTACLILKAVDDAKGAGLRFRVVGYGQQASRGVRAGNVIDINAAEVSIRAAVEQAERMAGLFLKDVHVGVSCGQPRSQQLQVEVPVVAGEIASADVERALAIGQARFPASDRDVLHVLPGDYRVDGSRGIRNPVGMLGHTLGVTLHAVSVASGPLRNLEACVGRCHLGISGRALSSYVSGLATLVPDEMELGATVIDMGGGTTSLAVFMDGRLVHADVLPVGGHHVTSDIARGLSTSLAQAERLKTLHGSALTRAHDARENVSVQPNGDDALEGEGQVPRSVLNGIIQPRIEETFELLRDRLAEAGLSSVSARQVVLTGGASQLNGVRDLAARILSKQVRCGRPVMLADAPETASGPAFSVCAGLAARAVIRPAELAIDRVDDGVDETGQPAPVAIRGIVGLKRWFKENF